MKSSHATHASRDAGDVARRVRRHVLNRIVVCALVACALVARASVSALRPALAMQSPPVPTGAAGESAYDACPHVWTFERGGNSEFYALVLDAHTATNVAATIHVFLGATAYTLTLPAVAIDRPGGTHTVPFRSEAIVLRSPDPAVQPSMIVTFAGAAAACAAESRDLTQPKAARYEPLRAFRTLEAGILAEADSAGIHGLIPDAVTAVPACPQPVRAIRADHAAAPVYPEIARQNDDVGTSIVLVSLDARGTVRDAETYVSNASPQLDAAAREAARRSSYVPQIAACMPTAGTFLFRADFTIGS